MGTTSIRERIAIVFMTLSVVATLVLGGALAAQLGHPKDQVVQVGAASATSPDGGVSPGDEAAAPPADTGATTETTAAAASSAGAATSGGSSGAATQRGGRSDHPRRREHRRRKDHADARGRFGPGGRCRASSGDAGRGGR